jgi:glucose-1-phosphate thymidylyltransferase
MKALVLAAGYATRLRPLTNVTAKPLIPIGGRPIVDYVCDQIDRVAEVVELHVVSNSLFASDFESWARSREGRLRPIVQDDGSRSNDERLGAIGGIRFVVERAGLAGEDLLVAAGDNLFDFSLLDLVAFWRTKPGASCVAVQRCADRKRLSSYGVVELSADGRVTGFVEKPKRPASDLIATAVYAFPAEHVGLVDSYLDEGNSPDQPGNFLAWLHSRKPVYGFVFNEIWLDIGSPEQLREAEEIVRTHPEFGRKRGARRVESPSS